jgi:hypothetical protein
MIQDRFARHRLNEKQIDVALKTILDLMQAEERISFGYLHGSALELLSGEQRLAPRDIDVAIYLTGGDWMTIELELQTEFYRRTGLAPEVLDVHTLNHAPLSMSMRILRRGRLLFCRDPLQHADFLERISNSFRRLAGFFEAAYA